MPEAAGEDSPPSFLQSANGRRIEIEGVAIALQNPLDRLGANLPPDFRQAQDEGRGVGHGYPAARDPTQSDGQGLPPALEKPDQPMGPLPPRGPPES